MNMNNSVVVVAGTGVGVGKGYSGDKWQEKKIIKSN